MTSAVRIAPALSATGPAHPNPDPDPAHASPVRASPERSGETLLPSFDADPEGRRVLGGTRARREAKRRKFISRAAEVVLEAATATATTAAATATSMAAATEETATMATTAGTLNDEQSRAMRTTARAQSTATTHRAKIRRAASASASRASADAEGGTSRPTLTAPPAVRFVKFGAGEMSA